MTVCILFEAGCVSVLLFVCVGRLLFCVSLILCVRLLEGWLGCCIIVNVVRLLCVCIIIKVCWEDVCIAPLLYCWCVLERLMFCVCLAIHVAISTLRCRLIARVCCNGWCLVLLLTSVFPGRQVVLLYCCIYSFFVGWLYALLEHWITKLTIGAYRIGKPLTPQTGCCKMPLDPSFPLVALHSWWCYISLTLIRPTRVPTFPRHHVWAYHLGSRHLPARSTCFNRVYFWKAVYIKGKGKVWDIRYTCAWLRCSPPMH